jgi:hypothetical protein
MGIAPDAREQRVVIGVDGCQAPAGEYGGDRGLTGAGTACDLDSAHRCLSSASPEDGANEFVIPLTGGHPDPASSRIVDALRFPASRAGASV